mgnify:CR=1 FL=1
MTETVLTLSTLLPLLGLLLQALWLGRGRPGGEQAPPPSPGEMRPHLVWKMFYVNAEDPRGWVPKMWGHGKTVNFRDRRNVYLFTALLLTSLGSSVLLALNVL